MYASIGFNPSIKAVLDYHEEKVSQQVAECIAAENFIKDGAKLSYEDKLYPFQLRATYSDAVKKKVFHTTIKFGATEDISNATAAAIGREYMQEMGFGNQPYLIYRHRDAAREHVHLVSSTIDREGKWIRISKSALLHSQALTERLARKWGLQTGYPEMADNIPQALGKMQHGLGILYPVMNRILEEVIPQYKYTDLPELNAVLRLHQMEASRGKEHTLTYRSKGLHYHPLKADGERAYEYLPARRFPIRPTLANLEKRFAENQSLRASHRESLTALIDYTLAGKGLSLEALKQALAKRKVSLVGSEDSASGRQIWFVDHHSKAVFEGAALGKDYAFAALQKRLISEEVYQQRQETQQQTQHYRHSL